MTPKSAAYILQEHCVGGEEFLKLHTLTQMGMMADFLSKAKVGPVTLEEFRRAAANLYRLDQRKRRREQDGA